MYGKLITREEAADILGVKSSTIGRYWRQGKLSYKVVHRKRRCILDEVVNLLDVRKTLTNKNIRDEFLRLKYRVAQLERMIDYMAKKLEVQKAFVLSDSDMKDLYELAKEGPPKKIGAEAARAWAEALGGFGESDYSRIKILTKDPFPWSVFISFIDGLSKKIRKRKDFKDSVTWNQVFLDLQVAKDQVIKMAKLVFQQEGGAFLEDGDGFIDSLKRTTAEESPAKLKPPKKTKPLS